jgi:hypothetical protein
MDRVVLTISSELFDDNPRQEASVRTNVTVRGLIDEIRREFNLVTGNYTLTVKGGPKPLEGSKTIEQVGLQTGAELVFERERRRLSQQIVLRGGQVFQTITSATRAMLREESTGTEFELEWQPALIGRADASHPDETSKLAVDLGEFAEARSVSRQHARITEQGGRYFLESLAERNPTFLNDREMLPGEKRVLQDGDHIRLGKFTLVFSVQKL